MNRLNDRMKELLAWHDEVTAMGEADADNHEHEKVWEAEVELLSRNPDETLEYLDSIESADDLESLSEIIDMLIPQFGTKKDDLISCFKRNGERLGLNLDEYLEGF